MQLDQKLANCLMGDSQFFDDLAPPHRTIKRFQQAPPAGAGQPIVPSRSFRNDLEVACLPAHCRTPTFGLVLLGKSESGQRLEGGRGLCESELRLHGDFGL
jgi:hypothetical protein